MLQMAIDEVTNLMIMISQQRDRRKMFAGPKERFLAQPAEKEATTDIVTAQRRIRNRYGFMLNYEPLP